MSFLSTPIGVIHRNSPDEAVSILEQLFKKHRGDDRAVARALGVSRHTVRRYRGLYPKLKELAVKEREKAAREALALK